MDTCEYPESLGGAGDPDHCGVTPGAWYPLGDSDLTTWPERAWWGSASAGGIASGIGPISIAVESAGSVLATWRDFPKHNVVDNYEYNYVIGRWGVSGWEAMPSDAINGYEDDETIYLSSSPEIDLALDRSGNPVVVAASNDVSKIWRWRDEDWVLEGSYHSNQRATQIAVDSEDRVVVVHNEVDADNSSLYVRRWSGSDEESWHVADNTDVFETPGLTIRENGNIILAWIDVGIELCAMHVEEFDGEDWKPLGDPDSLPWLQSESDTCYFASSPGVVVDDTDQVLVAWNTASEALVAVFDGSDWSPAAPGLWSPQLVQGPEGSVYLSGRLEFGIESGAAVWRWDEGDWVSLAAPDTHSPFELAVGPDESLAAGWIGDTFDAQSVNLMVNTNGEWRELGEVTAEGDGLGPGPAGKLVSLEDGLFLYSCGRVSRWDGASWQVLDLSDWTDLEHCADATLTETSTGQPLLALWIADDSEPLEHPNCDVDADCPYFYHDLYLLGWTGAGWEALTEPYRKALAPQQDSLSIAFDPTGAPFVATTGNRYDPEGSGNDTYTEVSTWDEAEWQSVGDDWGTHPVQLLALPDGRMLATWYWTGHGRSAIYAGGEWQAIKWNEGDQCGTKSIRFGLDRLGRPHAARITECADDPPAAGRLALYRLTETRWQPVGFDESSARLAMLPEEMRLDAYSENGEIYVRRFEGGAWLGLAEWSGLSASDRGGGVSNSEAWSVDPSVAMHDGTTCVAWMEPVEQDMVQLVRCHD